MSKEKKQSKKKESKSKSKAPETGSKKAAGKELAKEPEKEPEKPVEHEKPSVKKEKGENEEDKKAINKEIETLVQTLTSLDTKEKQDKKNKKKKPNKKKKKGGGAKEKEIKGELEGVPAHLKSDYFDSVAERKAPKKEEPRKPSVVSDAIDIAKISDKGRGYIANQDIKSGTLLVGETALRSDPFNFHGRPDDAIDERVTDSLVDILLTEQKADPRLKFLHFFKEDLEEKKKRKKTTTLNVTDEEWRVATAQVKANAIVFGERPRDTDSPIARMHLLPLASFFNHSCKPNAAFALNEEGTGRAAVYAIEDIKANEEITVCYHSELLYLPTKKRQAQLLESHKFNCHCSRCNTTTPSESDVLIQKKLKDIPEDEMKKLKANFKALIKLKQTFQTEGEAKTLERLCTLFLNIQPLHFCHWRMYQIRDACIYATIALFGTEKTPAARQKRQSLLFSLLEAQMLTQEKVLPQYHPDKMPVLHAYQKYKQEDLYYEQHQTAHAHGGACGHNHGSPDEAASSRKIPVPPRYQAVYDHISKIFQTE